MPRAVRRIRHLGRVAILASCLVAVSALAPRAAHAQQRPPLSDPPPLAQSLQTLAQLLPQVPNGSIDLNFAEFRARLAVSRLQELAANWPAQSPADYRANLAREVAALGLALRAGDKDRLVALLESLADDLEIKLEHCKASGGKLGGSVTVQVRTLNGGNEVGNWQVFYVPKVFDVAGAAGGVTPDRFPQLSSPTRETLVPGRYIMWVRDASNAATGERVVVKVGEGKKDLLLDLPVPGAR